jgi:hypothetical protein
MMHGAGVLCATLTLLGLAVPAHAESAPAGSTLQVGGLKPPAAVQSDASATPSAQTEIQLDRADKEDSGRGLSFVYLDAEAGPEYLGLHTLKASALVDAKLVRSKGARMVYGAGLGVRLLVFTFGARVRYGNFSDWHLLTLNAEAGMLIPLGRIEPYFTLALGYASLAGFDPAKLGFEPNSAHGLDLRGGGGVDVYLSNTFSVGGKLTADVLFLSRKAQDLAPAAAATPDQQNARTVFGAHGSGIGAGATLSAVLGLHF